MSSSELLSSSSSSHSRSGSEDAEFADHGLDDGLYLRRGDGSGAVGEIDKLDGIRLHPGPNGVKCAIVIASTSILGVTRGRFFYYDV